MLIYDALMAKAEIHYKTAARLPNLRPRSSGPIMSSIFLNEWKTPFNLPPFDQISDDDFLDAFEEGVKEEFAQGVDAISIASNPEPPTFANTIEAGFAKDTILDRVLSAFYAVNGADTNAKREEIAHIFPKTGRSEFKDLFQ